MGKEKQQEANMKTKKEKEEEKGNGKEETKKKKEENEKEMKKMMKKQKEEGKEKHKNEEGRRSRRRRRRRRIAVLSSVAGFLVERRGQKLTWQAARAPTGEEAIDGPPGSAEMLRCPCAEGAVGGHIDGACIRTITEEVRQLVEEGL